GRATGGLVGNERSGSGRSSWTWIRRGKSGECLAKPAGLCLSQWNIRHSQSHEAGQRFAGDDALAGELGSQIGTRSCAVTVVDPKQCGSGCQRLMNCGLCDLCDGFDNCPQTL